ncbi:MAG: HAD hydrolase family protein, partial [Gammaproteobacteria bacterium]
LELAVISGRSSDAVALRMAELGIKRVFQGDHDKLPLLHRLLSEIGISAAETAFLGDDEPDIPVLRQVGLAACPADAHPSVKEVCQWVGRQEGGRGAVREFCDFVLSTRPATADSQS